MATSGQPQRVEGYEPFFGLTRGAVQPRSRPSFPVCERVALGRARTGCLRARAARAAGRHHRRDRHRQDAAVPDCAAAAPAQDVSLGHQRPAARTRRSSEGSCSRTSASSRRIGPGSPRRAVTNSSRRCTRFSARWSRSRRTPSSSSTRPSICSLTSSSRSACSRTSTTSAARSSRSSSSGKRIWSRCSPVRSCVSCSSACRGGSGWSRSNRDEVKQYITHRLARARDGEPPSQLPGATELAQELADWAGDERERRVHAGRDARRLTALGGLPRVINLLCDRSLEEAYASRLRIIDRPLIHDGGPRAGRRSRPGTPANVNATARSTQAGPDESFWTATRSGSETADPTSNAADETAPVGFSAFARPAAAPRLAKVSRAGDLPRPGGRGHLVRRSWGPTAGGTDASSVAAPASSAHSCVQRADPTRRLRTPIAPAPKRRRPLEHQGRRRARAHPRVTRCAVRTRRRVHSASASTSWWHLFGPTRARRQWRAEVAALGLPIRRRVSDSWQQVVSGPFASRSEAEAAQQRLHGAGLTGTQIASSVR